MAGLKRSLSLWQLTMIGVGIILGAGIYVLIGEAAGLTGNSVWISFLISSIVCVFTGLSYAELASIFPKSGAEYVYIDKIMGRRFACIVGWLIILNGIIGSAAVAVGFGNYFSALFNTPVLLAAVTVIILSGVILLAGIKESALFTILFTIIETIGLVIIIFIGAPYIGSVDYFEAARGLSGIFEAGTLIFFAFIGFESLTRLSEETKDPEKNVPRALILSLAITTVIYVLVAISCVSVIGWESLSSSSAPVATVASAVFGNNAFLLLSFIALFSTSNTVLVLMLTTSRLLYGIAEFKTLPRIFLSISRKNHTPWVAVISTVLLTCSFVFLGALKTIANLSNFIIFITFILVNMSVICLRIKNPDIKGCFRTPFSIKGIPVFPVLGIITCLFMLSNIGFEIILFGVTLIIFGFILLETEEVVINHKKMFHNFTNMISRINQK